MNAERTYEDYTPREQALYTCNTIKSVLADKALQIALYSRTKLVFPDDLSLDLRQNESDQYQNGQRVEGWSPMFAVEEIKRAVFRALVWVGKVDSRTIPGHQLKEAFNTLGPIAVHALTEEDLKEIGCLKWSETTNLYLFPLYLAPFLPYGLIVTTTRDRNEVVGFDDLDDDSRMGHVAYGIRPGDVHYAPVEGKSPVHDFAETEGQPVTFDEKTGFYTPATPPQEVDGEKLTDESRTDVQLSLAHWIASLPENMREILRAYSTIFHGLVALLGSGQLEGDTLDLAKKGLNLLMDEPMDLDAHYPEGVFAAKQTYLMGALELRKIRALNFDQLNAFVKNEFNPFDPKAEEVRERQKSLYQEVTGLPVEALPDDLIDKETEDEKLLIALPSEMKIVGPNTDNFVLSLDGELLTFNELAKYLKQGAPFQTKEGNSRFLWKYLGDDRSQVQAQSPDGERPGKYVIDSVDCMFHEGTDLPSFMVAYVRIPDLMAYVQSRKSITKQTTDTIKEQKAEIERLKNGFSAEVSEAPEEAEDSLPYVYHLYLQRIGHMLAINRILEKSSQSSEGDDPHYSGRFLEYHEKQVEIINAQLQRQGCKDVKIQSQESQEGLIKAALMKVIQKDEILLTPLERLTTLKSFFLLLNSKEGLPDFLKRVETFIYRDFTSNEWKALKEEVLKEFKKN